jgi:ketosteroid isomerase-like protein
MSSLQPAAQRTLATWYRMIRSHETSELASLLAEDIVFHSPVAHKPYSGVSAVSLILQTAAKVFVGLQYHRELVSADGLSVVLEFSAAIGEGEGQRVVKGIDMIRFDDAGQIVEFEVMVRPATGLQALAEAMSAHLLGRV